MPSFLTLPVDLHREICEYLPTNDMKAVSQSSLRLRGIYGKTSWKKCVIISDKPHAMNIDFTKRAAPLKVLITPEKYSWFQCDGVRILEIRLENFEELNELYDKNWITPYFPYLRSLSFKTALDQRYYEKECNALRNIKACDNGFLEFQSSRWETLDQLVSLLEKDNIHQCLKTLILQNFYVKEQDFDSFLSAFKFSEIINLEEFEFYPLAIISSDRYKQIFTEVATLPKLRIVKTEHFLESTRKVDTLSAISLLPETLEYCGVVINNNSIETETILLPQVTHLRVIYSTRNQILPVISHRLKSLRIDLFCKPLRLFSVKESIPVQPIVYELVCFSNFSALEYVTSLENFSQIKTFSFHITTWDNYFDTGEHHPVFSVLCRVFRDLGIIGANKLTGLDIAEVKSVLEQHFPEHSTRLADIIRSPRKNLHEGEMLTAATSDTKKLIQFLSIMQILFDTLLKFPNLEYLEIFNSEFAVLCPTLYKLIRKNQSLKQIKLMKSMFSDLFVESVPFFRTYQDYITRMHEEDHYVSYVLHLDKYRNKQECSPYEKMIYPFRIPNDQENRVIYMEEKAHIECCVSLDESDFNGW